MSFFDRLRGKKPVRQTDGSSSGATMTSNAEQKRHDYTIAMTQRMLNSSFRSIEQKHGVKLQRSDARLLLRIHTDLLSHAEAIAQFEGPRQGLLLTHLSHILSQCRDILTSSEDDWATIAEGKLTKEELVDAMDIVLASALLMVIALKKKDGVSDHEIDEMIISLPIKECGPFAKDVLRQLR